jgi:hypothetical protein
MPMSNPKPSARPVKEKFYVRVAIENGPMLFCDATAYIGKEMPYQKPQATCAMRVEPDAVYFSLLHVTRKQATDFAGKPIKVPRGPVVKMQKTLAATVPGDSDLWVEVDLGDDGGTLLHRYQITRDENSVGRLEVMSGYGVGEDQSEDPTFDLPIRALEVRVYLRAPRLGRVVAVNFIGHVGKPRTPETVGRVAAMVLNSISGLAEFRQLADIETMKVPAPPAKWAARPAPRKAEDRVMFNVPLRLFTPEYEPVGAGDMAVEVDLESINQATGRLLFHLNPPEHIDAAVVGDYRSIIADIALVDAMRKVLGEELDMIAFEIMLGEISAGTIERLREAGSQITGIDATPREYRLHDAVVT